MNSRLAPSLSVSCFFSAASLWLVASAILVFATLAVVATIAVRLAARRARDEDLDALAELKIAEALLAQDDPIAATLAASRATARAKTPHTRNMALNTLAWSALGAGYVRRAKDALERIDPQHAIDLYCFAAVQSADGNSALAIRALELLRSGQTLTRAGAKLLVDLHFRQNNIDGAVAAASRSLDVLGLEDGRTVVAAACEAGAYGSAVALASALFGVTCARQDAVALVRALSRGDDAPRISRALEDMVSRFRRTNAASQARSLVAELRTDRSLPRGTQRELDRILRGLDGNPVLLAE